MKKINYSLGQFCHVRKYELQQKHKFDKEIMNVY
jgi:hypothetical protein